MMTFLSDKKSVPKISVITPSYNQGEFLEQTITSVLSQDYPNLEYIVLDGGSQDSSLNVIQKYKESFAYWRSVKDDGQAAAIAEGMELSTGDILCWLNSDDMFLPGTLRKVASWFKEHQDFCALAGGAYRVKADGGSYPIIPSACTLGADGTTHRLIYYGQDGIWQPATFWRRDAYFQCGGIDPSMTYAMDREFFIRLSKVGKIKRYPELLAAFRVHGDAKTTKLRDESIKENQELEKRYGALANGCLYRQLMYWRYRFPAYFSKLNIMYLRVTGQLKLYKTHD